MCSPVPFTHVTIEDDFWSPRLRVNRERTIPIEYRQCRETGRIDAFRLDWEPGRTPIPHIFWDSDVAKWIEAASYTLATHPDPRLDALLDEVIALVASAQQPDGYLNTHFTAVEPDRRWTNLRDCHELYCAGHLIEAGVAHYQATGKRALLDVTRRYADYIAHIFGRDEGQIPGYPGHEEIELALVKLYRVTGETRYLRLSEYFINERGRRPHYFDIEARARGEDPAAFWAGRELPAEQRYAYMQAHLPAREQERVVGHAVRAMYLYSAMADLAAETGDVSLFHACERLWDDLVSHKLYITGGVGSARHNEGFTDDYDLPNLSAYAETCAAVGLVFWAHRMLQATCDSRYADVMERALYNGVLSGVSLDGERFFYENPLASDGRHHRQPWFDCACCPPNLARLLASLGQYIYSQGEDEAVVHLYIQGSGRLDIGGREVVLRQETRYPWEGAITLRVEPERPATFGLRLRMPDWRRAARLSVNGETMDVAACLDRGYIRLEREWRAGDRVLLELDMPVERVSAHPDVRQNVGRTALQRGPLVYCLEQVDQAAPVQRILLPADLHCEARFEPDLLGGVMVIEGKARIADVAGWGGALYRPHPPALAPGAFTAIPYYAWDNRQPGAMQVWIPIAKE